MGSNHLLFLFLLFIFIFYCSFCNENVKRPHLESVCKTKLPVESLHQGMGVGYFELFKVGIHNDSI